MSYADWAAKWWQWGLSIPADQNPFTDPDGSFCDVDQSGSVFFLASNLGGTVVRTCTVPAGKALFFTAGDGVFSDCVGCETEAELRAGDQEGFSHLTVAQAEVDGEPLQDLAAYYVETPVFIFTLPTNNVFAAPPGDYEAVAGGYYLMLEPLPAGQHVIHLHYEFPFYSFTSDITYEITVRPHR